MTGGGGVGWGAQRCVKSGLPWVCSHTTSPTAEGVLPRWKGRENPHILFWLVRPGRVGIWERKPAFMLSLTVIYGN